jgi:hypothetical protein
MCYIFVKFINNPMDVTDCDLKKILYYFLFSLIKLPIFTSKS